MLGLHPGETLILASPHLFAAVCPTVFHFAGRRSSSYRRNSRSLSGLSFSLREKEGCFSIGLGRGG